MASLRCPTCKVEVLDRAHNTHFPFCSQRCRTIDLGKWLGESFRIASESSDDDEDGNQAADARREDA